MVRNPPAIQETRFDPWLGKDPWEKGMAIHSSILAWRITWTEEPGRLQSIGLDRIGHAWSDLAHTHTLWNDHHDWSSTHLPLYKAITTYSWPYSLCCVLDTCGYFFKNYITGALHVLLPFTCFAHSSLLLWQEPVCSLSMNLFSFCLFNFYTPHVSEMMHLSFSVWLILFSIIPSRSICVVKKWQDRLPPLWLSNIPL